MQIKNASTLNYPLLNNLLQFSPENYCSQNLLNYLCDIMDSKSTLRKLNIKLCLKNNLADSELVFCKSKLFEHTKLLITIVT